jgi:ABC-type amino acid transport substrate-binding protein
MVAAIRAASGVRGSICLAGDGSEHAAWLVEPLRRSLAGRVAADLTIEAQDAASGAADVIRTAGCSAVAWTGFDPLASALAEAMREGGLEDVRPVGSEAIKGERLLAASDGGVDGTVVTCPCVDLTTSTRIDAQRFVHDFQSAVGSPPGVFAVEAWDVASMLLDRILAGATDRDALAAGLDGATFDGLAGLYAFGEEGELVDGSARVVAYRAEGLRWLPVAADQGAVALPVRTRGYLAVGSCRLGAPFRYRRAGEPAGFEVELIDRVAGRLGLVPIWSELPCPEALRALDAGRLDAVLAPAGALTAGTPASRVLLALDAALVVRGDAPPPTDPAAILGPEDSVGVVEDPAVADWAAAVFEGSGARLRSLPRAEAYERLERGGIDAVADLEYAAWAATERRPGLWVSGGRPTGQLDVVAGPRQGTEVLASIDRALGRLIASGRYALLFGAYFPGAPIPASTGGSGAGA